MNGHDMQAHPSIGSHKHELWATCILAKWHLQPSILNHHLWGWSCLTRRSPQSFAPDHMQLQVPHVPWRTRVGTLMESFRKVATCIFPSCIYRTATHWPKKTHFWHLPMHANTQASNLNSCCAYKLASPLRAYTSKSLMKVDLMHARHRCKVELNSIATPMYA
jgi:hypothetical protein